METNDTRQMYNSLLSHSTSQAVTGQWLDALISARSEPGKVVSKEAALGGPTSNATNEE
jgi:hypothetical protein